jgi:hypothetical protein
MLVNRLISETETLPRAIGCGFCLRAATQSQAQVSPHRRRVLGSDGLSRFEELSRREAADTAILYAFNLIERDGDDLRNLPFLDRKAALARYDPDPRGPLIVACPRQSTAAFGSPRLFLKAIQSQLGGRWFGDTGQ